MIEQPQDGRDNSRVDELLDSLFVEGLNDTETQELWTEVIADKALVRRYVELVHLREGLPYMLSQEKSSGALHEVQSVEGDCERRDEGSSLLPPTTRKSNHVRGRGDWRLNASHWRPEWVIAVSLTFVLGSFVPSIVSEWSPWRAHEDEIAGPRPVNVISSGRLTPFGHESRLGKVTGLSPVASATGVLAPMQVGQELRWGEVVQLAEGVVRVRLESGPELLVQGPAEFSLVGEKNVFVRKGRISAAAKEGLVLQSPLVTADCLDAQVEFITEDDTETSVYARQGIVTVFSTPQEETVGEKLRTLHEHEGLVAKRERRGKISVLAGVPNRTVVDSWEDVESNYSDYQKLILSDHPSAYWTLEHVRRNRRVLDLSQNGFDGMPIGNWAVETSESKVGSSGTYFNGESYIEPDHKPPVNMLTGFSVEAWAQPTGGPGYRAIFSSRWVYDSHTPTQRCLGYTLYAGDTNRWEFWTGPGQLGRFWNVIESPDEIEESRWTHIVGTFTPNSVENSESIKGVSRLYVDGNLAIENEHEVSLTGLEWPARIGASEYVPRYLTSWLYTGYLRDIALYDYPLEQERIETHYLRGEVDSSRQLSQLSPVDSVLIASSMEHEKR